MNVMVFWALYYNLKSTNNVCDWWPTHPHISFLYINEKISTEKQKMLEKMTPKSATLNKIALVHCSGHYSTWKILNQKLYNYDVNAIYRNKKLLVGSSIFMIIYLACICETRV